VQYVLLAAVLLSLVYFADWPKIGKSFFNVSTLSGMWPELVTVALINTVVYTALGFAFAFVVGLVLALMRLSQVAPYRWLATSYIEFFRGVPALIVFIAFSFGVPIAFGVKFDDYSTVMLSLGLVGSAYVAETIRAGIQAVPKGQIEAARSLGMSDFRTTITVVIPQAFRIILPPLTNELIMLTKDSSLIYLIGVTRDQYELTKFGREWMGNVGSMTPLVAASLCYLLITIPLSRLSGQLEKRSARKAGRAGATV
jgi:polar amino acid transport system permease protein